MPFDKSPGSPVGAPGPSSRSGLPGLDDGVRKVLRRATWLSFWAGVVLLAVKLTAWRITDSAAIFSDAVESMIHVVAVAFVVYSLRLSQKPPDREHPYGHAKISYFSAGFEGGLICLAGLFILYETARRWFAGVEPQNVETGVLFMLGVLVINGGLGLHLLRLGRKHGSLILSANGRHVLTDAWTSIGVLAGLALVWATGWPGFDPLCAVAVALNILWAGVRLLMTSAGGLMDRADPAVRRSLVARLDEATGRRGITWHQMRHRSLGRGHWVDLHLVFEDDTTVRDAHEIASEVEREIRDELGHDTVVNTHLEPAEDHERIHGHAPGADAGGRDDGEAGHLPD